MIKYYSRSFTAIDGFWFNIVKSHLDYSSAHKIDKQVWMNFYPWEAKKLIKLFNSKAKGVEGVLELFTHMTWIHSVDYEISEVNKHRAVITFYNCPVLSSLEKAGANTFPCIEGGKIGKHKFAQTIDSKVGMRCTLEPPRKSPQDPACRWEIYLIDNQSKKNG